MRNQVLTWGFRVALVGFVLALAALAALSSSGNPSEGIPVDAQGRWMLEAQFAYGEVEAYQRFQGWGPKGREAYHRVLEFDALIPLVYGLLLETLLVWLVARSPQWRSHLFPVLGLPLLAIASDYVENALLLTVVDAFPRRVDHLAAWASAATSSKWILTGLALVAILALGSLLLAQSLRRWYSSRRSTT